MCKALPGLLILKFCYLLLRGKKLKYKIKETFLLSLFFFLWGVVPNWAVVKAQKLHQPAQGMQGTEPGPGWLCASTHITVALAPGT